MNSSLPNRETAPAGLLLLADFCARVPERAMDAIERERQMRELHLLSIHQMKKTYSWNPGRTIWMALLIGVTVFLSFWSMSTVLNMFGSTGQTITGTMKQLSQLGIELPPNVAPQFGSLMNAADVMPKFTMGDTIAYTIGSMVLYAIYRFFMVMPNLDRIKILHEEEKRLEEELRYLSAWMNELIKGATEGSAREN